MMLWSAAWLLLLFADVGHGGAGQSDQAGRPTTDLRSVYFQPSQPGVRDDVPAVARLAVRLRGENVPLDYPFHAGDKIRFEVVSNKAGIVFLFHQGPSGTTRQLWPDSHRTNNRLQARVARLIPDNGAIVFDEEVGQETFFVVISPASRGPRQPNVGSQGDRKMVPASTEKQILVRASGLAALQKDIRADLNAGTRGVSFRPDDGDRHVYFGADPRGRWAIATFQLTHAATGASSFEGGPTLERKDRADSATPAGSDQPHR